MATRAMHKTGRRCIASRVGRAAAAPHPWEAVVVDRIARRGAKGPVGAGEVHLTKFTALRRDAPRPLLDKVPSPSTLRGVPGPPPSCTSRGRGTSSQRDNSVFSPCADAPSPASMGGCATRRAIPRSHRARCTCTEPCAQARSAATLCTRLIACAALTAPRGAQRYARALLQ